MSYSCIAFVHSGNDLQLSCDKICSAILLDRHEQTVSGTLIWSEQNALSQPVHHRSSKSDAFDISNGHTASAAKPAAEVTHMQQDIRDCDVSVRNKNCRLLQFVTPANVFLLKMNAHLSGCITKTLRLSPKFTHGFINYARHCARKCAVFPLHNVSISIDFVSTLDSHSDVALDVMTAEETVPHTAVVHLTIVVLMTPADRLWIDYHWYCWLID